MQTISTSVPDDVGDALSRQARALLLGRRQYIRALLAAVARADGELLPTRTTLEIAQAPEADAA